MKSVMARAFVAVSCVLSWSLCPVMYLKGKKRIVSDELLFRSVALHSHMSLGWPRLLVKTGGKITTCSSYSSFLSCCCMCVCVLVPKYSRLTVLTYTACALGAVALLVSMCSISAMSCMKLIVTIEYSSRLCSAVDSRMRSCGLMGCRVGSVSLVIILRFVMVSLMVSELLYIAVASDV